MDEKKKIGKGAKFVKAALDPPVSQVKKTNNETLDESQDVLQKFQEFLDRAKDPLNKDRVVLDTGKISFDGDRTSALGGVKIPAYWVKIAFTVAAAVGVPFGLPLFLPAASLGFALLASPLTLPISFKNEFLLKKKLEEVHYDLDNYKRAELFISDLAVSFLNNVHTDNQMNVASKFEVLRERIHIMFFLVHKQVYVNKNPDMRVLFSFTKHLLNLTTGFYDDKYHLDFQIVVSELIPMGRETESLKYEIKCLKKIISEHTIEEIKVVDEVIKLNNIAEEIRLRGDKVTYERVAEIFSRQRKKRYPPSTFKDWLNDNDIEFDWKESGRFYPKTKS